MPNKTWTRLNELDRRLRTAFPIGMRSSVDVTIEKVTGFELFNTRPYHNYETWSDGYRVRGGGFHVEEEDLDEAINRLCDLVEGKVEAHPWDRDRADATGAPAAPQEPR